MTTEGYRIPILDSEGLEVIDAAVAFMDQLNTFNSFDHKEVRAQAHRLQKAVAEWHNRPPVDESASTPSMQTDNDLERQFSALVNRNCLENVSNTPDFILAQYLIGCLASWNMACQQRETWYGRNALPSNGTTE